MHPSLQAYFFVKKHYPKNLTELQLNTWLIGDVGAEHVEMTRVNSFLYLFVV